MKHLHIICPAIPAANKADLHINAPPPPVHLLPRHSPSVHPGSYWTAHFSDASCHVLVDPASLSSVKLVSPPHPRLLE